MVIVICVYIYTIMYIMVIHSQNPSKSLNGNHYHGYTNHYKSILMDWWPSRKYGYPTFNLDTTIPPKVVKPAAGWPWCRPHPTSLLQAIDLKYLSKINSTQYQEPAFSSFFHLLLEDPNSPILGEETQLAGMIPASKTIQHKTGKKPIVPRSDSHGSCEVPGGACSSEGSFHSMVCSL